MDIQFYGANCVTLSTKNTRLVVDDNLVQLGSKSIIKPEDVALYTGEAEASTARLTFTGPGEYEAGDISVIGIAARGHMDEEGFKTTTMYKIMSNDVSVLITGRIYPQLSDEQLEQIGIIDVLIVPVGGNGYSLDPLGAQKIMRAVEPKLVIPTHYEQKGITYPVPQQPLASAVKELGLDPSDRLTKLKVKEGELPEVTQLVVLERP